MEKRRVCIYTKTGDAGMTSLYTGERRSKTDPIFEALGDIDELNASIGVARSFLPTFPRTEQLSFIQSRLLDIGSALATPRVSACSEKVARTTFDTIHSSTLESWIDEMDAITPPLHNFILPVTLRGTHFSISRV